MSEKEILYRTCDHCGAERAIQTSPALYGGGRITANWFFLTAPTSNENIEKKHFCGVECLKNWATNKSIEDYKKQAEIVGRMTRHQVDASDGVVSPEVLEAFRKIKLP